jgi:hypothetical protein
LVRASSPLFRKGPQGTQGPQGPAGAAGVQGPTGNTGPAGFQGNPGAQGRQGNQGATGNQGPAGVQGPAGTQGPQGPRGPQGNVGPTGPTGNPGAQGPSGFQGNQGGSGLTGRAGFQGPPGFQGFPGVTPTGPTGPTGPAGFQGPVGPPGPQGAARGNTPIGAIGFQGAGGGGWGSLTIYVTGRAGYGPSFPNSSMIENVPIPAGSFYSTGAVTQNYSDVRLKTNIAPIDNAITKITALRGVEYNWNPLGREFGWQSKMREVGLIAQDVQKVLPEAVEPFINVNDVDYYTLHYTKIIPLAIESIKEQQQQIFRIIDKMKNKNLFTKPIDNTKFSYRTEL